MFYPVYPPACTRYDRRTGLGSRYGRMSTTSPVPGLAYDCSLTVSDVAPLVRSVAFHGTLGLVGFIIYR